MITKVNIINGFLLGCGMGVPLEKAYKLPVVDLIWSFNHKQKLSFLKEKIKENFGSVQSILKYLKIKHKIILNRI